MDKKISTSIKPEFIIKHFHIPKEKVQLFYMYIENKDYSKDLLNPKNELLLIEFLVKESKLFLKEK